MNNDIHHLIDLYFAGETTLQQEQRLRKLLLENAGSGDPAVEEALAVMSFTAASRPEKRVSRTPVMLPWMRPGRNRSCCRCGCHAGVQGRGSVWR